MNVDIAITILMLWSTLIALFANLIKRKLNWGALDVSFATLFLTGLGGIVGIYLAGGLSFLPGTHSGNAQFFQRVSGFAIGVLVTRSYIVPKMVIPKFSQEVRDEEITQPPSPPQPPQE